MHGFVFENTLPVLSLSLTPAFRTAETLSTMADSVRRILEEMVPELDALESAGTSGLVGSDILASCLLGACLVPAWCLLGACLVPAW
jgi:hypothetical protein